MKDTQHLHLKEQQYIWFMGGDLNSFGDITLYEMKGVGHGPGGPLWDPWSMSLNAPHHKEQDYTCIWLICRWRSERFQDNKHFVK